MKPYVAVLLSSILACATLAHASANRPVGPGNATPGAGRSVERPGEGPRERITQAAKDNLGIKEATGQNDGPMVDKILASVGLKGSRSPWCAAWNRYIYDLANLQTIGTRSAWSPDWVSSPTWKQGHGKTPLPGDTWGLAWSLNGEFRVRHTGIVAQWGESCVITFEGNTNADAVYGSKQDRDGGGSHSKRRLTKQIYAVRNWID